MNLKAKSVLKAQSSSSGTETIQTQKVLLEAQTAPRGTELIWSKAHSVSRGTRCERYFSIGIDCLTKYKISKRK